MNGTAEFAAQSPAQFTANGQRRVLSDSGTNVCDCAQEERNVNFLIFSENYDLYKLQWLDNG